MKISAKDEYGLRILLRIAEAEEENGISISQLSEAEGLSTAYIAKITRLLRIAGFVRSHRGHRGGYILSKPAHEIRINQVLKALDGPLYDTGFCHGHAGALDLCAHNIDCSVRSLWRMIQHTIDQFLDHVTLQDLMRSEEDSEQFLQDLVTDETGLPAGKI